MRSKREWGLDSCGLFLLAAVLIWPWFKAGYLDVWASIECTFIADARYLIEHGLSMQWYPMWYAGTRSDYVYPPGLRFGTAALAMLTGQPTVRTYHEYTAFFYCLGVAGVYWLIRQGTKSRLAALVAGVASALVSPSFLLLKEQRLDSRHWLPYKLNVLVRYGEGPHMSGMALVPFALMFSWRALEQWRPVALVLAAVFAAGVVSNNFYAATGLALFYPILVWSFWVTERSRAILVRAAAIPALAYGLTAFWLTPSYIRITTANMKYVAMPGNWWSVFMGAEVAAIFAAITAWICWKRPERRWAVFVSGSVIAFVLLVVGNAWFDFRISGEPHRLVPELDIVLLMGVVTVLAWLWNFEIRWLRVVAGLIAVGGLWTSLSYVRSAWSVFPPPSDPSTRIEYKIADWMWRNLPEARIHASGSVRFWMNVWHDQPQLLGGSDQGTLIRIVHDTDWQILYGNDPETAILWLQCLGTDAIYVPDIRSQSIYHGLAYPTKFAGVLPVLYDNGRGDVIYEVPRRFPARARLVETKQLGQTPTPRGGDDVAALRKYRDLIEDGPDAAVAVTWKDPNTAEILASVQPGQSVIVQETFDPSWQATAGGKPLNVRQDPMGFMAIDTPPGPLEMELRFVRPLESWIGDALTLLTVVGLGAMVWLGRKHVAKHAGSLL